MQNLYSQGELEYFRSMYPKRVKNLQKYVDEACDRIDYKNSPIYDEFPDRMMIEQLFGKIRSKVYQEMPELLEEILEEAKDAVDVEEVEVY